VAAFLADYEIEDALRIFRIEGLSNMHRGARIIDALRQYADANSDGWHMWQAPRNAAKNLIEMVEMARRDHLRGHFLTDLDDDLLTRMLVPVKRFLTRERIDYNADLPWAALFPLT
jgi:hypothetical protein